MAPFHLCTLTLILTVRQEGMATLVSHPARLPLSGRHDRRAGASGDTTPPERGAYALKEVLNVPKFMDVHEGMVGVTPEALAEAHAGDLAIQAEEGVSFEHAWADPVSGKVFCMSEAPSAEAIQRIHTRNGIPPAEIHELKIEV